MTSDFRLDGHGEIKTALRVTYELSGLLTERDSTAQVLVDISMVSGFLTALEKRGGISTTVVTGNDGAVYHCLYAESWNGTRREQRIGPRQIF
jgi:hypothetical protein